MTSKKSKRAPNAPKKPATGYILYCNDNRDKLSADIKSKGVSESGKALGEMWSKASPEEKERYNALYRTKMAEYNEKNAAYKKTPEYAEYVQKTKQEKISSKKGTKSKRALKPKKVSGYNVWLKEAYANLKAGVGEDKPKGLQTKALGGEWNALSKVQKEKYERLAEEINKAAKEEKDNAHLLDIPEE